SVTHDGPTAGATTTTTAAPPPPSGTDVAAVNGQDSEDAVARLDPIQNAQRLGYHDAPQSQLNLVTSPRMDRTVTREATIREAVDVAKVEDAEDTTGNLVIAHGYGCGIGNFYRNYNSLSLAEGWRIFSIDWLGMGRSSRPLFNPLKEKSEDKRVDMTEDFFVESLEAWREKMGLQTMTLVGHSIGGYFCAVYALRYPERVNKLILVSPAGIPEPDYEFIERIKRGDVRMPVGPNDTDKHTEASGQAAPKTTTATPLESSSSVASPGSTAPSSIPAVAATPATTATGTAVTNDGDDDQVKHLANTQQLTKARRFILSTMMRLWDRNYTPQWFVRAMGPFGVKMIGRFVSHFSWLDQQDQADLAAYMYHITAMRGSGEYAICTLFYPGVFARRPLINRLDALKMPVVFMYGTHDWMDYQAAEAARKRMHVPTKLYRVPQAGHNIHLENPKEFDRIILAELAEMRAGQK
ncbi:hypothetical protein EV182_004093, partial [Spiromyces aspiralis]